MIRVISWCWNGSRFRTDQYEDDALILAVIQLFLELLPFGLHVEVGSFVIGLG